MPSLFMKKFFGILVLFFLILTNFANAKKSKNTWDFPFNYYKKFKIEGSKNAYEFESNLRKDNDVLKEIKNNKETGLISYLLFEDNKIVIKLVSEVLKELKSKS